MTFCEDHWKRLRQKIDDRGLSHLIAKDGKVAAKQLEQQITEGGLSKETFDPLMSSHWAIVNNAMRVMDNAGINPLYLMCAPDADSIAAGRNDCPLCELNLIHKQSCTNPECSLDKERGYDWMLDRAADEALERARQFKLVGLPS